MNIGILGAGRVGAGLARLLAAKGHAVMLSYGRDAEKVKAAAASLGVEAGTPAEAAAFGGVVVLATPYTANEDVLGQAGSPAQGKVLWDCTNPLKPDFSGLLVGTTTSGAEQVAALAPWARVVKAIPPFADVLNSGDLSVGGERPSIFVCGDDANARQVVGTLLEEIGCAPVDAGGLSLARYVEPANMLLVALAYAGGMGSRIGLVFRRG